MAGTAAAALALAGCGPTNITGTAAPQGHRTQSSNQGGKPASTVADLGAAVRHGATQHNSVHVTMAMSVPGLGSINSTGDMVFRPSVAEHLTMAMPSVGDMEMVLVNGTMYMKLPAALAGPLGETGKPWTRFDLSGDNPVAQSLGSTADLADQVDPAKLIQQIAAAGTITRVTHDAVNGVPTTHYAITVDVAKMATSLSGNPAEQQAQRELAEHGVRTVPFDVWVDADNLPVRVVTHVAYAEPATGQSAQVTVTINYTDWGKPVTITAPPADQVGSLGGH